MADGFKPSDGQQIKISLVLRNAQNAIIYGDITFVDWPGNGRSAPFSITVYDLPKYASYDLYCANLVVDFAPARWLSGDCQACVRVTCALVLRRAWPNR